MAAISETRPHHMQEKLADKVGCRFSQCQTSGGQKLLEGEKNAGVITPLYRGGTVDQENSLGLHCQAPPQPPPPPPLSSYRSKRARPGGGGRKKKGGKNLQPLRETRILEMGRGGGGVVWSANLEDGQRAEYLMRRSFDADLSSYGAS